MSLPSSFTARGLVSFHCKHFHSREKSSLHRSITPVLSEKIAHERTYSGHGANQPETGLSRSFEDGTLIEVEQYGECLENLLSRPQMAKQTSGLGPLWNIDNSTSGYPDAFGSTIEVVIHCCKSRGRQRGRQTNSRDQDDLEGHVATLTTNSSMLVWASNMAPELF